MFQGGAASVDGYIGYYEPYATSHAVLDLANGFVEDVRNAARTLVTALQRLRDGALPPDDDLKEPRPK